MNKQCSGCKKILPIEQFWKRKHKTTDGYNYRCIDCTTATQNKYMHKNFISVKLWKAKTRAKSKNIPFDLTKEDVQKLWDNCNGICEVLNIPMVTGDRDSPNNPSIDRLDSSKGYTKDNVRIISYRANTLKGNATLEELEKLLDYMKRNRGDNK